MCPGTESCRSYCRTDLLGVGICHEQCTLRSPSNNRGHTWYTSPHWSYHAAHRELREGERERERERGGGREGERDIG